MKRWIWLLIIVAVAVCTTAVWFSASKSVDFEGTFRLGDYHVTYMPEVSGKNVGEITDANTAAEKANQLWREVYGREFRGPMVVRYDPNNGCWLIESTLSIHAVLDFHYFPAALIFEDGTVKDCWLGQF